MIYEYRKLEPNENIVIGADPSEGGDYSAFVAISKKYSDVVLVGRSKEESSQLGYTLERVGQYINKQTRVFPTIAVERNTGQATILVLKQLNYPELYRMPTSFIKDDNEEESDKYGWSTNTASRPKMLDDLLMAVRQRVITIPSKEIIDEMTTFIRNEKTGKPEADKSAHDDLVMALAIAWQLYLTTSSRMSESEVGMVYARNRENAKKWSGLR